MTLKKINALQVLLAVCVTLAGSMLTTSCDKKEKNQNNVPMELEIRHETEQKMAKFIEKASNNKTPSQKEYKDAIEYEISFMRDMMKALAYPDVQIAERFKEVVDRYPLANDMGAYLMNEPKGLNQENKALYRQMRSLLDSLTYFHGPVAHPQGKNGEWQTLDRPVNTKGVPQAVEVQTSASRSEIVNGAAGNAGQGNPGADTGEQMKKATKQ